MPKPSRRARAAASVVVIGMLSLALAACVAEPGSGDHVPASATSGSGTPTASATASASPAPSGTPTAAAARIPTDCRAMVSAAVLAEFGTIPLNDPAAGASGPQQDGSLICVWRDPGADTTGLVTTISRMARGPALDMLNGLVTSQGFSCYTPSGGTRCEKTWPNTQYPVTDGRTLFWRDGILIDTRFSNLAPAGYTDSIIAHVFG